MGITSSNQKKVLFVITKSNWGGAQRYVYNLATTLPKEQFLVSVALGGTGVAGSGAGELDTRLKAARIPTFYIPAFAREVSILHDIRAFFELYHVFKKEQPSVVHLNSSKAGGVGALAARFASWRTGKHIEIIFTSHGLVWDEDRNRIAKILIYTFSRVTFLLCHKVITISYDNFERARSCFACREKIYLIHNGLPNLQFETRERARVSLALRGKLKEEADGGAFWIGTIAELTHNKGLTYLIQAISELAPLSVHLFIIGSGEDERKLNAQILKANLQNNIHLIGFVSDAYRYNKAFDLFTLASVKEGLPTVLLEAGQASIAVVATEIPGTKDIIIDEKTGLLVEPKNPKALAEKIATLMKDSATRARLAQNLNQKVLKEFSIEQMVEETKKLY